MDLNVSFPNLETLKITGGRIEKLTFSDTLKTLIIKGSPCDDLYVPDHVNMRITDNFKINQVPGGRILNVFKYASGIFALIANLTYLKEKNDT